MYEMQSRHRHTLKIDPQDFMMGHPSHGNGTYQYMSFDTPRPKAAKEVNETLNLNLGLKINPINHQLRWFLRFISNFFEVFEEYIFRIWDYIPLRWRQNITFFGWKIYFPLHKCLLGKRTAIHRDASYEYHALTTLLYWGRLFPVTIRRMRFSLSQLSVWHPPSHHPVSKPLPVTSFSDSSRCSRHDWKDLALSLSYHDVLEKKWLKYHRSNLSTDCSKNSLSYMDAGENQVSCAENHLRPCKTGCSCCNRLTCLIDGISATVFRVHHDMIGTKPKLSNRVYSREDGFVTGFYVQHGIEPSNTVIFWLYGGAFLSGDSKGNLNIAEKVGQYCQYSDVFIPNYRLLPEYSFYDALHDVLQAYEYLVTTRNVCPSNIVLLGVSSGGGLIVRLLQTLVEYAGSYAPTPSDTSDNIDPDSLMTLPLGAVLLSPFVDYTEPSGSFVEYTAHDLIVNQSVFEVGVPYFNNLGDSITRHNESPVYRSLDGLPPLCIVVSEHETCFDQVMMLYEKALSASVLVDIAVWKYMCHVFPLLSAFIPEGVEALNFICEWINQRMIK